MAALKEKATITVRGMAAQTAETAEFRRPAAALWSRWVVNTAAVRVAQQVARVQPAARFTVLVVAAHMLDFILLAEDHPAATETATKVYVTCWFQHKEETI